MEFNKNGVWFGGRQGEGLRQHSLHRQRMLLSRRLALQCVVQEEVGKG